MDTAPRYLAQGTKRDPNPPTICQGAPQPYTLWDIKHLPSLLSILSLQNEFLVPLLTPMDLLTMCGYKLKTFWDGLNNEAQWGTSKGVLEHRKKRCRDKDLCEFCFHLLEWSFWILGGLVGLNPYIKLNISMTLRGFLWSNWSKPVKSKHMQDCGLFNTLSICFLLCFAL